MIQYVLIGLAVGIAIGLAIRLRDRFIKKGVYQEICEDDD
jgi:hypothetical protein